MINLFEPNNHSVSEIKYKEVSDNSRRNLQKILLENYGLTKIDSIAQVQETEINSNNFRVVTPNKTYLLRRNSSESKERVRRSLAILKHCKKSGVPTSTIISPKKSIDNKDHIYTLFEFLECNHFRGTIEELKQLGEGVALLHKSLFHYSGEIALSPHPATREPPGYSEGGFKKIFGYAKEKEDAVQKIVLEEIDYLIDASKKVSGNVKNSQVRVQPIHFDLHPHNTLFSGSKLEAILDFDSCCQSQLVRDVGFALHRGVRQYVIKQQPVELQKTVSTGKQAFLKSYEKINPLSREELESIPFFIQDEALERTWNILVKYYLKEDFRWEKDIPKQISAIKEAEHLKNG